MKAYDINVYQTLGYQTIVFILRNSDEEIEYVLR